MAKKLDLDHVTRPRLPWRLEPDHTECGRPLENYAGRLITPQELLARIGDLGKQRAAYTTCMTCWDVVRRWRSDTDDPITAVYRALDRIQPWNYAGPLAGLRPEVRDDIVRDRERRESQNRELRALGMLVEAHREEFDQLLADLAGAPQLDQLRARRRGAH